MCQIVPTFTWLTYQLALIRTEPHMLAYVLKGDFCRVSSQELSTDLYNCGLCT